MAMQKYICMYVVKLAASGGFEAACSDDGKHVETEVFKHCLQADRSCQMGKELDGYICHVSMYVCIRHANVCVAEM